jgi:phosphoribosylformylglycinamidine synthase
VPKAPEPLTDMPESTDIAADLLKLLGSPNLASRRWVWEQYDQSVGADTVQRPGGDAAVVRVHGSKKALAITTDCTPRYCYADPYEGGKQAVAEAYRNLCAVGAKPLAITNCLNFGNPQRPEIMGQFVGCVEGMAEACRALDFPVVSGNVSLYNETKNEDGSSLAILPTPAIGGVGLLEDWQKSATIGFKRERDAILLLWGGKENRLDQSLWLREVHGRSGGRPPPVSLDRERKVGEHIRDLIARGLATAVHDLSDGGLLVALAEMALASNLGAWFYFTDWRIPFVNWAFGEGQGRYLVTCSIDDQEAIVEQATKLDIHCESVGSVGGDCIDLEFEDEPARNAKISLADLRAAHEGFFPKLMGSELSPEF